MPPLFTKTHIIARLPRSKKSFTLVMIGLESQLCYGVLNLETFLEKNLLLGWLLRFKSVIL